MAKYKKARILLNLQKPWSSSFFDEKSRLNLTIGNPMGVIFEITPNILVELTCNPPTLIDVDNVIDVENCCFKDLPEEEIVPANDLSVENLPIMNVITYDDTGEQKTEVINSNKQHNKQGKNKNKGKIG